MDYSRKDHSAAHTRHYVFNQLIPYIGNKRKLLPLIGRAIKHSPRTSGGVFVDLFAGSSVVSRYAKSRGMRVIANDWEPYARVINSCYITTNGEPRFAKLGGYEQAIRTLNELPPRIDWVTEHLCPRDDDKFDVQVDRMFYMRKNGMRIDAIRHQTLEWCEAGLIDQEEEDCLLAPLLYQACYRSNTSGVFKGFHNGWGGQTGTALYRIATDLVLEPAVFHDNGLRNEVYCMDAQLLAEQLATTEIDIAYLDPPYNQHPYGSNYHVLNSVALWDKPEISKSITAGSKSAIRTDWRTERRSAYNYSDEATTAYRKLIGALNARHILTSYSTDGMIRLDDLLLANLERGRVTVEMQGYKRYRVSSQRFSRKPLNVEYVIVLDTHNKARQTLDELKTAILRQEEALLSRHPETMP
ncbi:MAG: DNA adenine methylase [candidate division Zixibacteria bacterium]|nr:DNA adenine methylase [candidate division Zixibacteria bacterium]